MFSAARTPQCSLKIQEKGVIFCFLVPTIQKAERRLTAVPLPALFLLRVQREMQFSYWHSRVLNSLICLSFLQQHLRLVNNPGMGAIRAVRQSKVIINLLKCMRDVKCERKREKKNVPGAHFIAQEASG